MRRRRERGSKLGQPGKIGRVQRPGPPGVRAVRGDGGQQPSAGDYADPGDRGRRPHADGPPRRRIRPGWPPPDQQPAAWAEHQPPEQVAPKPAACGSHTCRQRRQVPPCPAPSQCPRTRIHHAEGSRSGRRLLRHPAQHRTIPARPDGSGRIGLIRSAEWWLSGWPNTVLSCDTAGQGLLVILSVDAL